MRVFRTVIVGPVDAIAAVWKFIAAAFSAFVGTSKGGNRIEHADVLENHTAESVRRQHDRRSMDLCNMLRVMMFPQGGPASVRFVRSMTANAWTIIICEDVVAYWPHFLAGDRIEVPCDSYGLPLLDGKSRALITWAAGNAAAELAECLPECARQQRVDDPILRNMPISL